MLSGSRYCAACGASCALLSRSDSVGAERSLHRRFICVFEALPRRASADRGHHRLVVAVDVGEVLDQLHAAAVAMHVAEAANIHKDVEPETMPRVKRAQQLVVLTRDARCPSLSNSLRRTSPSAPTRASQLAIRIVAVGIQQRGHQLDLKMLSVVEQIDDRRRINLRTFHQFRRQPASAPCGWPSGTRLAPHA